jgi:hypothetical protein
MLVFKNKGKGTMTLTVQRLKELRGMHRDHHGYVDLIDDHLPERVLGNVCSVLESSGNTLKGSSMLEMVLVIFGNIM